MRVFTITDYGGVADGKTDCGPALRRAWAAALRESRRQAREGKSTSTSGVAAQQRPDGTAGSAPRGESAQP